MRAWSRRCAPLRPCCAAAPPRWEPATRITLYPLLNGAPHLCKQVAFFLTYLWALALYLYSLSLHHKR